MITVRIKGGLGNQMFQYAVGYALATQAADEVCFDPAFTPTMTARSYKRQIKLTPHAFPPLQKS